MTHDAETVERAAKAIYEVDVSQDAHPECMPNWEDIHAYHDEYERKARAALSALPPQEVTGLLDPDMPDDQMRLHGGEMTAQEIRTARAFIGLANAKALSAMSVKDAAKVLLTPDSLGRRSSVYDACEGVCKVHRFDKALRAISEDE